MRRVRESLLLWKSYTCYLSVCVRARVPACVHVGTRARGRVHARTCMYPCLSSTQRVCAIFSRHLWPLSLHHIFRRYLINDAILGKKSY